MNKLAGCLGVLAMFAVAPLARADFQITVNGSPCVTNPIGPNPLTSASPNGTLTCATFSPVAGVTIQDLAVTGLQAPGFSQQLGTTLLITNTTGSNVTLQIDISDSNFSSPTIPPALAINDSSGATLNNTTGTNTLTLTSCVAQSNSLAASPCVGPAPGQAGPNGTLTESSPGTAANETTGVITALHANFSLVQQLIVVAGAGGDFNVTSSQVLTPVPEPASFLLLGGMLAGISGLLRKRVAKRS
jgi:hypothetical protein